MPTFADVTLPTDGIALVVSVVGTLWTAIVLLWREDRRRGERERADIVRQRDALLDLVLRRGLRDEVPASVPRSLLPPLPTEREG